MTYRAPFAQAMMGKKINEDFTMEMNGNNIKFTITSIEKITASTPTLLASKFHFFNYIFY